MEERLTIDEIIEHCKRQTEKLGRYCYKNELGEMKGLDKEYWEHKQVKGYLEELKKYRKLDEQGKILILPCKPGSKVYLICSRYTKCTKYGERFEESSCCGCEEDCDSHREFYIHVNQSVSLEWIVRKINEFGKTVFLTEQEAKKAKEILERKSIE